VLYDRALVEPGSNLDVDVILVSRSETPIDRVKVTLTGEAVVSIPQGKTTASRGVPLVVPQSSTWMPGKLGVGEYRRRLRLVLPQNIPPSYRAGAGMCRVAYFLEVHVAIPMWIDRHATFTVPIAVAPRMPNPEGSATIVATHPRGPTSGETYIEASLDATQLEPGDELRGDVSFANVSAKRIRRVTIAFVVYELTRAPLVRMNVVARWAATLVSGPPPEGETFPFRFPIPRELSPSFDASVFALQWQLEVRVDVVLGNDVLLTIPLDVIRAPHGVQIPERSRRALPVGRERLARLWSMVAQRLGVSYDDHEAAMIATRGAVTMKLVREAFQGTLGIVAHYRYPHLGLDLHLGARALLDSLVARGRYEPKSPIARERFTIVGRDPAQLDAFFDPAICGHLASATSVVLDDDLAHVRVAGVASSASALESVARGALTLLAAFDDAVARIPVPRAMAQYEAAWRACAAMLSASFEPGRVWIHDATLGGFRFELGTVWEPHDATKPKYTVVSVPIEPPLERAPTVEDASLSAFARDRFRELASLEGFHATTTEIGFAIPRATPDPATLVPHIESIVAVLVALRGATVTGPFR
jgi:hypothetical protein